MKKSIEENDLDVEAWNERADEPLLFTKVSAEKQAKYDEYFRKHPLPSIEVLLAEIKRVQNS